MMGRGDTFHGAFHTNLEVEIERVIQELEKLGLQSITKLEASALIAERSRRFSMNNKDVKDFIGHLRGMF